VVLEIDIPASNSAEIVLLFGVACTLRDFLKPREAIFFGILDLFPDPGGGGGL
jgi:hypothetical protein